MSEPKPYTLAELEDAPVDDIWGSNSTRIVVTKESVAATINDNARLRALIKEASIALSSLRPHLTLKTTEEWEQMESLHNRLAKAARE